MQCKDVECVGEQEGFARLPEAAQAQVATCSNCQEYVTDLATIVSVANELPAEVEPPARVWVSLQAQLELEGIIKTPAISTHGERAPWWRGFRDLFRTRPLATATPAAPIPPPAVPQFRHPPVAPPPPPSPPTTTPLPP